MKLNQVTIPSENLEKSLLFYQTLGFELIVDALPRYIRFLCPDKESTFSVHLVEKKKEGEGIALYFECGNLDQVYKELLGKGILFDHPPIDQTWLWREARLKDPDGNQLILYKAGKNRIYPPWGLKKGG